MFTGKKLWASRSKSHEEEDVTISTSFVTFEASIGGETLQPCRVHPSKVNDFKAGLEKLYKEFNVMRGGGSSLRQSVLNPNFGVNTHTESAATGSSVASPVAPLSTNSSENIFGTQAMVNFKGHGQNIFVDSKVQGSSTDGLSTIESTQNEEFKKEFVWGDLTPQTQEFIQEPVMLHIMSIIIVCCLFFFQCVCFV